MNCLDNYIGIRGTCNDSVPESGLYVNDLPGIDLRKLEGMSDPETVGFQGVFDRAYTRAKANFVADFVRNLPDDLRVNSQTQRVTVGELQDTPDAVPASANRRGVYITASGSPFMTVDVQRVQIYSASVTTTTVQIYDSVSGQQLASKSVDLVQGWNPVLMNTPVAVRGNRAEVFVCYDATTVDSIETDSITRVEGDTYNTLAKGATIATGAPLPIEGNLSFEGKTYGMLVDYSIGCDISQAVCINRGILKEALWYKVGIELLVDIRFNDDIVNRYFLVQPDELERRAEAMEAQYIDHLEKAMKGIQVLKDCACFECKSKVRYQSVLPG